MNKKLKRKYISILKKHIDEGLRLLEHTTTIDSELFQRIVVNVNNSANIVVQLEADLKIKDENITQVE